MKIKHTIRTFDGTEDVMLSPLRAIRRHCIECFSWTVSEIAKCSSPMCPLFPYRFGHDPGNKKGFTDEQKEVMRERMLKLRESQENIQEKSL